MRPKVLLVMTNRWIASARLAMAFQHAGVMIDAVGPPGHPIKATSAYGRFYPYHGLSPMRSFLDAMTAAQPDMVIPCDELARTYLNRIHAGAARHNPQGRALAELLERSLGDPSQYALIDARTPLIQLAREQGILAPQTGVVKSLDELRVWIEQNGLPAVLKTDGTSGGRGVKIARTLAEAEAAFRQLNTPPEFVRAFKRSMIDQDWSLVGLCLRRRLPMINIQSFVPGQDATIAVACREGKILASITVEVLRTWKAKGPASVVRVVDNPTIQCAARKLTARLKLSGLCGFDFVLQSETGNAYLIEMNPRATQTAHLPLGPNRDLPAALGAALANEPPPQTDPITGKDLIALFPSEWQNDSSSPYFRSAFHDVPWQAPKLVSRCVKEKLNAGGWLTYDNLNRLTTRIFRRPS